MKIKNVQALTIVAVLSSLPLEGQPSHARRRFLRLLKPYSQDVNEATSEIREKLADKGKDGKPSIVANKYSFSPENKKKMMKEIEAIGELEIEIDLGKSNKEDVADMKKVLTDHLKIKEAENNKTYTADAFDYIESLRDSIACLK